jgi:hypothetical protein
VALRSANPPRKRLLVHLSQAVQTLSLRKPPSTYVVPLGSTLDGNVKVQFLEVNGSEFDHFENISNALIRLDKGIYGRCQECGKRIEEDVLAETPWATACLECTQQE